MRGRTIKKALLAITLIASLGSAAQAAVTITSTVRQSGVDLWTQSNPAIRITTTGGWDFTGQAFADLTTIDKISITLTLKDADTGTGSYDYDRDKLTLKLGDYDTGLKLNGFGNGQTTTLTLTSTAPAHSANILAALQQSGVSEGKLVGYVWNANPTWNNRIGVPDSSGHNCTPLYATLSLTGQGGVATVPAPGAMLLCGLGTGLVGWLRRRRTV